MKNRRTIVMAFLLCACLIVGMGYAAISTNLMLAGTVNITSEKTSNNEEFDTDVYFTNVSDAAVAKITGTGADLNDTLTITLKNTADESNTTLIVKDNTISFTVDVQNDSSEKVKLEYAPYTTTDGDITVSMAPADGFSNEIEATKATTLVVTVKLNRTPTTEKPVNATIDYTFTATIVEA